MERIKRLQQERGKMSPIRSDEETVNLESFGIYKRYEKSTFENIEKVIPAQHRNAFNECREYAENFAEHKKKGVGMILKGPVGTGKTSLAVAILQKVIRSHGGGLFIPMASLMDNLLTMSKRDAEEAVRFENRVRSTPLLILDDLGAEYENNWVRTKVDAIITERCNRLLPVIVTTNLKAEELLSTYQERVYDRLKGCSLIVNFAGESMRKAPRRGA